MHKFQLALARVSVALCALALLILAGMHFRSDGKEDHGHVHTAFAQTQGCWPAEVPQGALPPAVPIWCTSLAEGPSTFLQGPNSWVDDFDHGLSNASLGAGYQVYEGLATIHQSQHFRHNDHWMVDLNGYDQTPSNGPHNFGGALMRPDRSFRFQDGRLVVEADVAAGIADYAGAAWPELIISTAPAPTDCRATSSCVYDYDHFAGHFTIGCRLQSERTPICAFYDDTVRGPGQGGRVWEISHFQCGNTGEAGCRSKFGGSPYVHDLESVWRVCRGTDPDLACRDRFRWEIEQNALRLYVNGTLYMEHRDFVPDKQLPARFLASDIYVYFGDRIFKTDAQTVRFHWDRIAVNPTSGGESVPPPVPTPEATPSPTPSDGAATPQIISFDDRAGQRQALNGQYPAGVIDWGFDHWFHAGPYGKFSTKSFSFDRTAGRLPSSRSFTFLTPRNVVQIDAYNGGVSSSTVTLTCSGQPDKQATLAPGQVATIATGWAGTCTEVTLASSNGWDTNFDNLVYSHP